MFFDRVKANFPSTPFTLHVNPPALASSNVIAGVNTDTSRVPMDELIRFDGVSPASDPISADLRTRLADEISRRMEWCTVYRDDSRGRTVWYYPASEVVAAVMSFEPDHQVRGFVEDNSGGMAVPPAADLILFDEQTGDFVRLASRNHEFATTPLPAIPAPVFDLGHFRA